MAKYALCIGINDYPGTENDLSGCVNDANDWATALSKRGFATTKMLDKQATGKNMRAAITAAIAKANAGDLVVIQYSGHGSYVPDDDSEEPDGKDECLCPYDINSKGPITDDELFEIYSAKKTGVKLLVISDSCHSGSNARFAPITTPPEAVPVPTAEALADSVPNPYDTPAIPVQEGEPYLAQRAGKLFHGRDCSWARRIPEPERVYFKRVAEAREAGYSTCPVCEPWEATG